MFGLCNVITYYIYTNNANNRTKLRCRFQCSWQYIILICYYSLHLYFPLVHHHSCAMLRFKRVRCACTVSDGDHHNHIACLALAFSHKPTLLSAYYCIFLLSISLYIIAYIFAQYKLFTFYFKFSKASYSQKYREK